MSHYRLGHAAEANDARDRAERRFGPALAEADSGYVGAAGIENWLIAQTLRREARELFTAK